jgi:hypothetical protein
MTSDKQRQQATAAAHESGQAEDDSEEGLAAEQDSAAAMDADVPQPPEADETTEGQPS